MLPNKLLNKINKRKENDAFRVLGSPNKLVDFSSNDYLGFSRSENLFHETHEFLINEKYFQNGATGSRLLSGNYELYDIVEDTLHTFHKAESALIFNSGYNANLGLFSSVPQRNDIIFYDELSHASIRDGIKMSDAKAFKFKHNNLFDLEQQLQRLQTISNKDSSFYIVTESVFSMDGDCPDLIQLSKLAKKHNAHLIVDEAHAIGVFGETGNGLINQLEIEVFARIITFGKALGTHGAAILCSQDLKDYLINFARPFIYTTGLPPHTLASILLAYKVLHNTSEIQKLHANITHFKNELKRLKLEPLFINSDSAIQCCVISGNEKIKVVAQNLLNKGFDVKAILAPTVPIEKERLRFCLHSYNTKKEISEVLDLLSTFAL